MMLPWLPLAAGAFLGFAPDDAGVELGVSFFTGAGVSSSEKDSHAASWMVTAHC